MNDTARRAAMAVDQGCAYARKRMDRSVAEASRTRAWTHLRAADKMVGRLEKMIAMVLTEYKADEVAFMRSEVDRLKAEFNERSEP